MATIAENLQTIKDSTEAIRQAIIDKGGTISGGLTTYADAIKNISGGEGGGDSNMGTVVKIKNKLNGATLGEQNKIYTLEEALYRFEVDGAKNFICFESDSLYCGIRQNGMRQTVYDGQGDGHQATYLITEREADVVGLTITKYNPSSQPIVRNDKTLHYLFVYDFEGNYDLDMFYIQCAVTTCFVKNTQISLANGITKLVQDINYNDELLVWNFDERKFDKAKPLWIKKEERTTYYYKVSLENGITINLVGDKGKCHRLFNYTNQVFESATDLVGKEVYTINGLSKVLSVERIEEECAFYNIITEFHMNLFANGILTSCRYNNLYPIKDMMFDKTISVTEPRYKIHKRFSNYPGILPEYVNGMRLDEIVNPNFDELVSYISNIARLKKKISDFEENITITNKIEETNVGWISPQGEVYGYKLYMPGQMNHINLAAKIGSDLCLSKEDIGGYSRTLEKLGWVKYTTSFISYYHESKKITDEQMSVIFRFLDVNKEVQSRQTIKLGTAFSESVAIDKIKSMSTTELTSFVNLYKELN